MASRIALILSAFRPGDRSVSVSELSRRTGLAKSTVSRIVGELVNHRFLERIGPGLRLGVRMFELGELAARPRDLRKLALASMTDLRNAVELTVHLAILEGNEVVYIEILPVRSGPRLPSRVGGRMPAHATGVGKALLALTPDEAIEEFIASGLRKVGPRTITDSERLWRELARIRTAGVSYEREESGPGIACAAAAITGAGGEPIAALSAAGWAGEFDPRRIGPAVQTAASALSRGLSKRPGLRFSASSIAE